MRASYDVAVVGAGHAGVEIAVRLRRAGFDGSLALIGDEAFGPYQRPPLTKAFLRGDVGEGEIALATDLAGLDIDHLPGMRVTAIDRGAKLLRTAGAAGIRYGKLALATGSRPRRLSVPGADTAPLFYLTTLADCVALQARVAACATVAIIGGGFIGLEAAATLCEMGKSVTLIEAQGRLLERSASETLSAHLADLHRGRGVDIRTGTGVAAITGATVRCTDGGVVETEAIIVGIGAVPNDELARQAGLSCDDGVIVDRYGVTSDPDIVAAGDCTRHPNDFAPTAMFRLESVQNAVDQAEAAASSLLGKTTPYRSAPTFWSDQFDARIGIVGLGQGADELAVRGDTGAGSFSTFAFRRGRLVAVESVNRPKDQRLARRLLMSDDLTADQVRDPGVDLAALCR